MDYNNIVINWIDKCDGRRCYFVTPEVGIDTDNHTYDDRMCGCDDFDNLEDALRTVEDYLRGEAHE